MSEKDYLRKKNKFLPKIHTWYYFYPSLIAIAEPWMTHAIDNLVEPVNADFPWKFCSFKVLLVNRSCFYYHDRSCCI